MRYRDVPVTRIASAGPGSARYRYLSPYGGTSLPLAPARKSPYISNFFFGFPSPSLHRQLLILPTIKGIIPRPETLSILSPDETIPPNKRGREKRSSSASSSGDRISPLFALPLQQAHPFSFTLRQPFFACLSLLSSSPPPSLLLPQTIIFVFLLRSRSFLHFPCFILPFSLAADPASPASSLSAAVTFPLPLPTYLHCISVSPHHPLSHPPAAARRIWESVLI